MITQNKKSSALIIALLISSVVGTMVLALGRQIIQNTFSTNRYSDEMSARSIAWAGIEDGLSKVKIGFANYDFKKIPDPIGSSSICPDVGNCIDSRTPKTTQYYPNFTENIQDLGNRLMFQKVYRRNLTQRTLPGWDDKEQLSGIFCVAANDLSVPTDDVPSSGSCNLWNNVGIYSKTNIEDSCVYKHNDLDANPLDPSDGYSNNDTFAWCDPSSWKVSDSYYDLRISGSDDRLGIKYKKETGTDEYYHRTVNIDTSDKLVDDTTSFYKITSSDATTHPNLGTDPVVDRLFDLSYWHGNRVSFQGTVSDNNPDNYQRIVMKIKIKGLENNDGKGIWINTFVKYKTDPNNPTNNKRLEKYKNDSNLIPKGGMLVNSTSGRLAGEAAGIIPSTGSGASKKIGDFIYWAQRVDYSKLDSTNHQEAWIVIPTPPADNIDSASEESIYGQIEYFGFRIRFGDFLGQLGCNECTLNYGFRTSAYKTTSTNGPIWYPRDDSFIGTGVTRILSTGVVNNTRKTIELAAFKDFYVDLYNRDEGDNYFEGEGYERCAGGNIPRSSFADLRNCSVKIYRQIKY